MVIHNPWIIPYLENYQKTLKRSRNLQRGSFILSDIRIVLYSFSLFVRQEYQVKSKIEKIFKRLVIIQRNKPNKE